MKKSFIFSFSLMGSIGLAVAVPLLILALLGRYIDGIYGSSPRFLLIMIALSTVPVYFLLRRIVSEATKKFNKLG